MVVWFLWRTNTMFFHTFIDWFDCYMWLRVATSPKISNNFFNNGYHSTIIKKISVEVYLVFILCSFVRSNDDIEILILYMSECREHFVIKKRWPRVKAIIVDLSTIHTMWSELCILFSCLLHYERCPQSWWYWYQLHARKRQRRLYLSHEICMERACRKNISFAWNYLH